MIQCVPTPKKNKLRGVDPLLWHLFRRYVHYKLMCIEVTKNVQRCVYPVVFPFQEKKHLKYPTYPQAVCVFSDFAGAEPGSGKIITGIW